MEDNPVHKMRKRERSNEIHMESFISGCFTCPYMTPLGIVLLLGRVQPGDTPSNPQHPNYGGEGNDS